MLDRDQIETFATIVECGSFERAAGALNVTRGAVSQRIKALEDSLATVLLLRDKPVRPTRRGEVLLRHVKALRAMEGATLQDLVPERTTRWPVSVSVAVNADSLVGWFEPVLQRVLRLQRIALEVVSDDQDHTFARLARGDVVGCISAQAEALQGFVCEPLGSMPYCCVASPGFVEEFFAKGVTLQAALSAPALLFDRKDGLHDDFLRRVFGVAVERYRRHYIPSPEALLRAAAQGGGYALLPADQAGPLLADGRLVELVPGVRMAIALHWHRWRNEFPVAQELSQLVIAEARQRLVQEPQTAAGTARCVPITAPGPQK